MRILNTKFQITILVIIASFLYLYKLDQIPNGVYVDEASSGYNAYSILKTGKDEYGKSFPLAFRFLGSYTPPLYTYFTTLPVYLFGLNNFSIRFISAFSGIGMSVLIYFILKEVSLFSNKRLLPIIGGILFTMTPWNVFYSRLGYEEELAFFLFSLGSYLAFKGVLGRGVNLTIGLGVVSLSAYGYHAQKLLAPLFIVGFLLAYYRKLSAAGKRGFLLLGLLIALLIQLPMLSLWGTDAFFTRGHLFYARAIINQSDKLKMFLPYPFSVIQSTFYEFFARYFNYFSLRSLFYLPDPDLQRSIPELSVFYPWMVIPFLLGSYVIWSKRTNSFIKFLMLLLIVAPIPASLAKDPFSVQRSLSLLLPLFLIIAAGIDYLITRLSKKVLLLFIITLISSSLLLWRSYFIFFPKERAVAWNYGFSLLADEIKKRPDQQFVFDNTRFGPAYIELAYSLRLDPKVMHSSNTTNGFNIDEYYSAGNFQREYNFLNIQVRGLNWSKDIYLNQIIISDSLTISKDQAKEHYLETVFEVLNPLDNSVIYTGYKTNPSDKCKSVNLKDSLCR